MKSEADVVNIAQTRESHGRADATGTVIEEQIPNLKNAKLITKTVTEKQRQANRDNAKQSTGPKTERGKAIASRNGRREGTCASNVITGVESAKQFQSLYRDLTKQWKPVGPTERFLVAQIANAMWKLRRIAKQETDAWNHHYQSRACAPNLESFSRAEHQAFNKLQKTLKLLSDLQERRLALEAANAEATEAVPVLPKVDVAKGKTHLST